MNTLFSRYRRFVTSTAIVTAVVTITLASVSPTFSQAQDGVLPTRNAAFEPEFTPKNTEASKKAVKGENTEAANEEPVATQKTVAPTNAEQVTQESTKKKAPKKINGYLPDDDAAFEPKFTRKNPKLLTRRLQKTTLRQHARNQHQLSNR